MSSLDHIGISVQTAPNQSVVDSILLEIATLLERYLQQGERGELQLQALPLDVADRTVLWEALGQGEVQIHLNVMGESEIAETQFPGVWRVTHKDREGRVVSETIEIAAVPKIVIAEHSAMVRSIRKINRLLEN